MRSTWRVLSLTILLTLAGAACAEDNDDFADAIEIRAPTLHHVAYYMGTYEPGEPLPLGARHSGKTLWYHYKATQDGYAVIDFVHNFGNPIISVFTGTGLDNLRRVVARAVRDAMPDGSYNPTLLFKTLKGRRYSIQIDTAGSFSITLSQFGKDGGIAVYPDARALFSLDEPATGYCGPALCEARQRNFRAVNATAREQLVSVTGRPGLFSGSGSFKGRNEALHVAGGGQFLVSTNNKNPFGTKAGSFLTEVAVTTGQGKGRKTVGEFPILLTRETFHQSTVEVTLSRKILVARIGELITLAANMKNTGSIKVTGCYPYVESGPNASGILSVRPLSPTGDVLQPVDISPGATRPYELRFRRNSQIDEFDLAVGVRCANALTIPNWFDPESVVSVFSPEDE